MADGAPMSNERVWTALDVQPADQGIATPRDKKPAAFRAEARDEAAGDRCHVRGIDRQKREPDRPSRVTDHDPAVDKFTSQARGDLARIG